ncbi:MAG: ABC transporter ATP-binding protein [Actinomycetota bacterium]
MAAAILTKDLTKRYGDFTAVDHLNLEVREGEIFGLLGPNGAGKTTTILMLLGLSEPAEGRARVAGLDPTRQPLEVKRKVGYLPDNVGFYGNLTARQNLSYTARLNALDQETAERRIDTLLDRVGLASVEHQEAGTFSRGMRQRLGIADALIKEPQILILDEPTVGIDPEGMEDILNLIQSLPKERGVTVLLSSHLLYQVQAICDRVGIFVRGKLVAHGPIGVLASRLAKVGAVIEVGAGPGAEETLRQMAGVEGINREGDILVVTANTDVRYAIGRALVQSGNNIWHLRLRGAELDDIYRQYFQGEGDGRG